MVFSAQLDEELDEHFEYETCGRVWLTEEQLTQHENLSFYMKDAGMNRILQEVRLHD